LNSHFGDEIKVRKRIQELDQKMETAALSMLTKKQEMTTIARDKGKDSIQIKIISEEIEETNGQLKELKSQLETNT
jgi:hypothetical protein